METKQHKDPNAPGGGKIHLTKKQLEDIEAFKKELKDGKPQQYAYEGEPAGGAPFLKAAGGGNGEKENMVNCLTCDAEIKIPHDTSSGELTTCKDCGENFEVVKGENGVKIKPAEKVGEDWGE